MAGIVEVRTVGSYDQANRLLEDGWDLHQIDAATSGENLWGYHLVRHEETPGPAIRDR